LRELPSTSYSRTITQEILIINKSLLVRTQTLLPALRIHSWGGLGSQLFALNAYFRIKAKFPSRRLIIIHHTGGITERKYELNFPQILVLEKRDYKEAKMESSHLIKSSSSFRKVVGRVLGNRLFAMGFINRLNTELELSQLKFWTMHIRGHYTRLDIPRKNLELIDQLLSNLAFKFKDQIGGGEGLYLHLRLGDLLTKKEESLVTPSELRKAIDRNRKGRKIYVFSDSSKDEVFSFVGELQDSLYVPATHPSVVIYLCVKSPLFIGTNSKISFWIAAIRENRNSRNKSIVPENILNWLSQVITNFSHLSITEL